LSEANSGANNPMYGKTHTPETRAQMSGANNHMYGKVPASAFESGNVPANAMTINIYDIDNVLVRSFTSQVAAAEWLDVSRFTVQSYIKSGKVWKHKYTLRKILVALLYPFFDWRQSYLY
jgi:group I intron endonuclease